MLIVIDGEPRDAQGNMDEDSRLLESLQPKDHPILNFYNWKNSSITYGYFIKPESFLNLSGLEKLGIDLGKRPTGGGIVFHFWDISFSFLLPSSYKSFSFNPLDNYSFVNRIVLKAIDEFLDDETKEVELMKIESSNDDFIKNFCMGHPTKYDLLIDRQKVVGAAQRRKKNGYLHQGTISLLPPDKSLLEKVLLKDVSENIFSTSYPLLKRTPHLNFSEGKKRLKELLIKNFQKILF